MTKLATAQNNIKASATNSWEIFLKRKIKKQEQHNKRRNMLENNINHILGPHLTA
jgi:hypothetical protein